MNYALTINSNNMITGVHESLGEITSNTFSLNPELKDDTVVSIDEPGEFRIGYNINCYNEDGIRKSDVWCIENDFMDMPEGMEIIDGELVSKDTSMDEKPISLDEYLRGIVREAQDEALTLFNTVQNEAHQMVEEAKTELNTAIGIDTAMTMQSFTAITPLMTELVQDKPANVIISAIQFILDWAEGSYKLKEVRRHEGNLYRCAQAHDSTGNPTWSPNKERALWVPYHAMTAALALPWVKPTGAHDMYEIGEFMIFTDDNTYECLQNTNFSPVDLPTAWRDISTEIEPEPINPEEPAEKNSNGTDVWSEWVPWNNYPNTLYGIGDRVTKNGIRYISTQSGNHWKPGEYGWDIVA